MPKFNRQRLVFGLYLLVLIAAAELAAGYLDVPAWPAFMAMIFFFAEHMNPKKAPDILVGAVAGIACILLAGPIIGALAPVTGFEIARLLYILGLVYAIVAFGEMLPIVFNNYAFMYLTVTGLAMHLPEPRPFVWMAVAGLGGGLLIAGVLGIVKFMSARAVVSQPG